MLKKIVNFQEDDANPIDVHVGKRLRHRRVEVGFTQERLAQAVGLTFQQVQKYERGANRIGASRLYQLSQVLSVSVSYFFEGLMNYSAPVPFGGLGEAPSATYGQTTPLSPTEVSEVMEAYTKITDQRLRHDILNLVRTLALAR